MDVVYLRGCRHGSGTRHAQVGEDSARVFVRLRFDFVSLRASRGIVPRARPRLQSDVRLGRVCQLLQSFHVQVLFLVFNVLCHAKDEAHGDAVLEV